MTPELFLARIQKGLAPAYLFLGAETYGRDRCRAALLDAALPPEEREEGFTHHDLGDTALRDAIDDARSLSLFASRRLILLTNAEAALPRTRASAGDDDESGGGTAEPLANYLKDPVPGVVLLFEAVRFEWEGDDKKKLERVRKFYEAIGDVVDLKRHSAGEARAEAVALARKAGVTIGREALDLLVESLGADVGRIAVEIEKLRLFAAAARAISVEDIAALVPDARATTIFALVNALGNRDRARALGILDTLTREGEYLPLALAFLSTQFRLALIARESGLRTAAQIQGHFQKQGVPMWGSRAEQVFQTAGKFSREQLAQGLTLIFEADRGMRSPRPDDRIVMENFIVKLTAAG